MGPKKKKAQPRQVKQLPAAAHSQRLYEHIRDLSKSLGKKKQSPQSPKNYRDKPVDHFNSSAYTLSYEDELHLADHFAFLAHVEEGVEFVSAVTLEEHSDPPSLVVRLASNHTPSANVVKGLTRILNHVKNHALEGKDRNKHRETLFDEVIRVSQKRIYARLRSSQWVMPPYMKGRRPEPLYKQIEKNLILLRTLPLDHDEATPPLLDSINALTGALRNIDLLPEDESIEALKDLVRKALDVSTNGNSKSLENHLEALGLQPTITQSREVLEIDKLSKYLELCNDLIRHSRKPKSRLLFMDIKLDICPAYPGLQPPGASYECFVHGEVQLVLFYEERPLKPLPRAIGSSKSACFLCDLFIEKHGVFGISHSHMRLYEKWRIPDTPWMNAARARRFEKIVCAMDRRINDILRKKRYFPNRAMESRAHILQLVQGSDIASSIESPAESNAQLVTENGPHMRSHEIPSSVLEPIVENPVTTTTLYYFQDLPISVEVVPTTVSCTLLVGKVDYLFDFEEVGKGLLHVCEDTDAVGLIPGEGRVDVRDLDTVSPTRLRCGDGSGTSILRVYDDGMYGLVVTLTWISD